MHHRIVATGALLALVAAGVTANAGGPASRTYAKDTQGIFWFMHISDVHAETNEITGVSIETLHYALTEAVDVINPVFLFATGDLTDASILSVPTSGQVQGEWDLYKQTYTEAGMTPSFYFDMPGNHDSYGDQGLTYFIANSMQGQATQGRLFADTTYKTALGEYYFVALNSSGLYGTTMSFGDPAFTNVADLAEGLKAHKDAQLTFAFAHHHLVPHGDTALQMELGIFGDDVPPTNAPEVSAMLQSAGAFYMHGHVHQYKESLEGKIVVNQLGKLGDNGGVDRTNAQTYADTMYRSNIGIGIVDHNAFIYRATGSDDPWPVVAITAPVDQYLRGGGKPAGSTAGISYEGDHEAYQTAKNPYAYDVCKDSTTNPIRALVLARDSINAVNAMLDGSVVAELKPVTPKGIYAGEMNTSAASNGLHHLTVVATVGKVSREDSIWVNFVAGPCGPQEDAGTGGAGGAGGSGGSAGKPEAGAPDAAEPCAGLGCAPPCGDQAACLAGYHCEPLMQVCVADEPTAETDTGSTGGCTTTTAGRTWYNGALLLAWVGLGVLLRRRTIQRDPHSR